MGSKMEENQPWRSKQGLIFGACFWFEIHSTPHSFHSPPLTWTQLLKSRKMSKSAFTFLAILALNVALISAFPSPKRGDDDEGGKGKKGKGNGVAGDAVANAKGVSGNVAANAVSRLGGHAV